MFGGILRESSLQRCKGARAEYDKHGQGRGIPINIGIDVIRILGEPTHVCIMKNIHNFSLAVYPYEAKELMSFQVPAFFLEDPNAKQ